MGARGDARLLFRDRVEKRPRVSGAMLGFGCFLIGFWFWGLGLGCRAGGLGYRVWGLGFWGFRVIRVYYNGSFQGIYKGLEA